MFRQHKATRIVFEVDYKLYKPVAPELFSSLPNGPPQVLPLDYPDRSLNDLGDNMLEYLGGNVRNGIEVVNVERTIPEVDEEGESVQMFESPLMMVRGAIKFEVGQTHNTVDSLRGLLREYAIQERINFDKVKNDKNRLTFKCKAPGCPWRIHASCMQDDITMMVKTYTDNHDCFRVYKVQEAREKWIASKFEALVKSNPDINIGVIEEILRERYKVNVNTQRPFIRLDGCHLKRPYKGILLSTVALDANGGFFPLVVYICEQETLSSWTWFLEQLFKFLKYPEDRPLTFMSDRQKGVLKAIEVVWPNVNTRFCA
ncbi:hypothetical protein Q3G72_034885 [Acer saccharum]|nr:hypothetical protein Q3G72_034885 [Acer saccharum]